jgi:hypothetical protein
MKSGLFLIGLTIAAATTPAAYAYEANDENTEKITNILLHAPIEATQSSFTMGTAIGVNAGTMLTSTTGSTNAFEAPEGMEGALAELNIGYSLALPYQIYGALEAFIDGRSDTSELETGSAATSYTFRQKSIYGFSLAAGWLFNRGDMLYAKTALIAQNLEREGSESADTGVNFQRSYRDSGMSYAVGFMMPNGQNSYLRYELVRTPSYGVFSNQLGNSQFNYQPSSYSFKLGVEYYFDPFSTKSNAFEPLEVNGIYGNIDISQESLMLDYQDKIDIAGGANTRTEKYIIPSNNMMQGYGVGYSSSFSSRNLYAGIEYHYRQHLSSRNKQNHLHNAKQDTSYQAYETTTYSLIAGFRPHMADLLFVRAGTAAMKLNELDGSNLHTIKNTIECEGLQFGMGFETSLTHYFSGRGEYSYTVYDDKKAKDLTVSPTSHLFSLGLVLRL